MKKGSIIHLFIIAFLLGLFQSCCFLSNKDTRIRVYYDKFFHMYIYLDARIGSDEIRIGKSMLNMDNIILFTHRGDSPTFKIIPQNDTVYIYDVENLTEEISNGSLSLQKVNWCPKDSDKVMIDNKWYYINYHFEDSTALLSTPKRIVFYSEWDVTPYLWNGNYAEEIERIF